MQSHTESHLHEDYIAMILLKLSQSSKAAVYVAVKMCCVILTGMSYFVKLFISAKVEDK